MHIALVQFYIAPNPDYENIASGLRNRGHCVWLGSRGLNGDLEWHDGVRVVAVQPGPAPLPKGMLQFPVVASLLRRFQVARFMLRIRRFLHRVQPGIVQVGPGAAHFLWALPIFAPQQMRFVLDIRQINLGGRADLLGWARDWWALKSRGILCRSVYDHACFNHAATAQKVLGERWQKWSTIVPVGLSPRFLSIGHEAWAFENPMRPVRFVYLGALTRFRALEAIFLASQQVLSRTNDFRVVLVGLDRVEGFYHSLVDELNLADVVTLMPPVSYEEVPELLASYDVGLAYVPDRQIWHLQPTIKVLEYRAAGLPILSSDVASHREVVEDGINGLLVPNSAEGLAAGMLQFVEDRAFLRKCQLNASRMRQAVTIEEVARMYEKDVYERLMEQAGLRLAAA